MAGSPPRRRAGPAPGATPRTRTDMSIRAAIGHRNTYRNLQTMEAERQNQLAARLQDYQDRQLALRRYL